MAAHAILPKTSARECASFESRKPQKLHGIKAGLFASGLGSILPKSKVFLLHYHPAIGVM